MKKDRPPILGFLASKTQVLLYRYKNISGQELVVERSLSGKNFKLTKKPLVVLNKEGKQYDLRLASGFRFSGDQRGYYLVFKSRIGRYNKLVVVESRDGYTWQPVSEIKEIKETGVVLKEDRDVRLFWGEVEIKSVVWEGDDKWVGQKLVMRPNDDYFYRPSLLIGNVAWIEKRPTVVAYRVTTVDKQPYYELHIAVLRKNKPDEVEWKPNQCFWEQPKEWRGKIIIPLGMVFFKENIISYWQVDGELLTIDHGKANFHWENKEKRTTLNMIKLCCNPVITPKGENTWENRATFNPSAMLMDGKVHIIYRAVGENDISMIGYAQSDDGFRIIYRHGEPIYRPSQEFEVNTASWATFYDGKYTSGGSYGGCEDARLIQFDNKVVMTYVAYDGANPPRIALTAIDVDDFLKCNWNWQKPVLISPPGVVDKNAVLFPEKVKGKYVMMHRIYPHILIDYLDNLDFDGKTKWLKEQGDDRISPRANFWDSRKVGAGAPPIKTKYGWLLIYHSVGEQDSSRYKIGAMILDLENPAKVLFRTPYPIISPEENYENEGAKWGVVYPCGAVIIEGTLIVYYGGADSVVCIASANLEDFLQELMKVGKVSNYDKLEYK